MSATDARFMARAIRLAQRGRYTCSPNPRVGCVLVRDEKIVGQGWHQQAGQAHAEVNALRDTGEKARGATAYVSLEPCNHQGRTGPCSQALIAAGVSRVLYAAGDDSASAGGAQTLRDAGVAVEAGLLANEARALNPGFHRRIQGGRPWLRLKLAMSLDGRAALADGSSQWITATPARQDGHRWRARSDAMISGIGTVLYDDPQMTARLDHAVTQPLRVVVDSQARTPKQARLRTDGHYLIAHAQDAGAVDQGLSIATGKNGLDLTELVDKLGQRGCNELLVEAGPRLSAAFVHAQLVDEFIFYVAPTLLGDGLPAADLGRLVGLDQRLQLDTVEMRRIGADLRIIARPKQTV